MNACALFEPAVSSQRWRGTPPPRWPLKRLKWSISGLYNGIWGDEPDGENDIICIRVADFDRVRRSVSSEPPTTRSVTPGCREQRLLRKGDLLIEKSGGGDNQLVGCVVHFDHDFEAVCSNFVARISLQDEMLPQYWNYVHSSLYSARLNFPAIKQTTGIQNLDAEAYFNIEVAFPPLQEQCAIANYLDRETTRIDALIAEKERMLALLEEKRAALISRVVTRGLDPDVVFKPSGLEWLDEIPAHWDTCQLKRTWASSDYGLSESIRDEGDIAVLRMSCIVDGRVDVSKSGMITEVDRHLLLRRNDLLFNRTNSLDQIAKVGLIDFDPEEPLTFASYLVRIRANHRATPDYLVALLNSSLFLNFARKNAIPAIGQANLSPTRYGEIHIALPPIAEQEKIVTFLKRDAETSTPIREHIRSTINLLHERRAALITAAVTGQITAEEMTG